MKGLKPEDLTTHLVFFLLETAFTLRSAFGGFLAGNSSALIVLTLKQPQYTKYTRQQNTPAIFQTH